MSQRICEIEHPRGRYSPDSSLCFPMSINTTVAVSACVKIAYISASCITRHVSQHQIDKMSLSSVWSVINNRKKKHSLEGKKSGKLPSVLRKLNYKMFLKSTAGVQATAKTIDTCSHFWWFIIPSWMQIKQNLSRSPALCMMDDLLREFHSLFCFFETLHRHPEPTHKNALSTLPFPAHRPRGETDTFTRSFTSSHDRAERAGL